MKQDSTTIEAVSTAFRLSAGERQYLLGCHKGEGLLFARGGHVALRVESSPAEHLLVTTDPRELAERSRGGHVVTWDRAPALPTKPHQSDGALPEIDAGGPLPARSKVSKVAPTAAADAASSRPRRRTRTKRAEPGTSRHVMDAALHTMLGDVIADVQ